MQKQKRNHLATLLATAALAAALSGSRAQAASFIVPPDQLMISKAKAIVVGTVVSTRAEKTASGKIETIATLQIEEVIKGKLAPAQIIELHELGGVIGDVGYLVPGSPHYVEGEKTLVFLDQKKGTQWATQDLALGRFDFATDDAGRSLLVRDEEAIVGWDMNGHSHKEKPRAEREFLNFVRQVAIVKAVLPDYFVQSDNATTESSTAVSSSSAAGTYPGSAYMSTLTVSGVTRPARWPSFGSGIKFYSRGNQVGYTDGGIGALQAACAAWNNDAGSNINYVYGGTTTATSGLNAYDTVNSVQFNDPNNEIAGTFTGSGTLGIGGVWINGTTNSWGGETFYSVTYGDVTVQDGVSSSNFSPNKFNQMLTHEIGHTLGLRHSDQGTPSSTVAIMRASVVDEYGAVLQQYDRDAVDTVYGGGTTAAMSVSGFTPLRVNGSTATPMTINGSGFQNGATVTIGGSAATNVSVASASTINATSPGVSPGVSFFVTVRNPDGTSANAPKTLFGNFYDVPNSYPTVAYVEAIARAGITSGCGNGYYCVGSSVTRAQMAKFLLLGKHGGSYVAPAATGIFNDVPRSDSFAPWIEQLSREGITSGCAANMYCPTASVTRSQMAKFLLLSKYGSTYVPPAATGLFNDVPRTDSFAPYIEQLYREGITSGCQSGYYCPTAAVNRSEMAVFLQRTFALPMNP